MFCFNELGRQLPYARNIVYNYDSKTSARICQYSSYITTSIYDIMYVDF